MVESTATVSEVTIKLTQLDDKCNESRDGHKYAVIFDSTGSCGTFFTYNAHVLEINKLSLGVLMGRLTKADAIEQIREHLVGCMRRGETFVLSCGKMSIDFLANYDGGADNLPIDKIFNFKEWRKKENYMKIVRPEEDHDIMNNKKMYEMRKSFQLIILQENSGDLEAKNQLKASIPHLTDSFVVYNVE